MRKMVVVVIGTLLSTSIAFAQTTASQSTNPAKAAAAPACDAKAVDKNGKPLAGAAKNAFMKKCEANMPSAAKSSMCASTAVDKNGKPLAGAAKSAFWKKCEATS